MDCLGKYVCMHYTYLSRNKEFIQVRLFHAKTRGTFTVNLLDVPDFIRSKRRLCFVQAAYEVTISPLNQGAMWLPLPLFVTYMYVVFAGPRS